MSLEYLQIKKLGAGLSWRLNRPERGNALGPTLARELHEALNALFAELKPWQEARAPLPHCALVLSATLRRPESNASAVWVAGGDLKELGALTSADEGAAYAAMLSDFCRRLEELPIPVIVAISGRAIGGGAELALAGDVRLASGAASLDFRQLRVGLPTGYGSTARLVELIGKAKAQELLLLARELPTAVCLQLGLFHDVAATEAELEALVEQTVAYFASIEPRALAAQKAMLRLASAGRPREELGLFREAWGNPTHRQFLASFNRKGLDTGSKDR